MKKILTVLFMCLISQSSFAMYNGSPDWRAPKRLTCYGIPDFPQGMKISPYRDQVFGQTFDSYIFINIDGALGLYYFDTVSSKEKGKLEGEARYIKSSCPEKDKFKVKCEVSEWYKD